MRFDVCGVDHLRVCGSSVPSKLPEQVFPDAAPRPAHKAVIDRRRRAIASRAIAPAAAALEHMHNPADDAAVVRALDTTHIRRQMRFNPLPTARRLAKIDSCSSILPSKTNQYRIVRAEKLMSSDPSFHYLGQDTEER